MTKWWASLQRWRDQRTLNRRPIPDVVWDSTLARYPFLALAEPSDAARLRDLATLFLARKEFHGAHGLVVTDAMAVAIAAQACLPILHLGLAPYDGFVGIVVHASEVVARREAADDDGVVHRYEEQLTGEAMEGGPLMLSWRDVEDAGETAEWGYNVVVHEFAHVLDMGDGQSDGIPLLPDRALHDRWQQTFAAAYETFCSEVDAGIETAIDPYAAETPAEFFAVACEAFFVAPRALLQAQPDVYALLRAYFRQDPAARLPA